MNITVERQNDPLHKEVWTFNLVDRHSAGVYLILSGYEALSRPTERHRKYHRESNVFYSFTEHRHSMDLDAVPLPADVMVEARQQLMDKLVVLKSWEDRNGT